MKISIFGMGYVGCVTAACLIKQGHKIIGVDVIDSKIDNLNDGVWPVYEPGLNELNSQQILKENFFVTRDEIKALKETEIAIVCVGTPSLPDGSINLEFLESVLKKINNYFKQNPKDYLLLLRSTIPPGSTNKLVYNRFNNLKNINIAFLPEFLREGSAINDFFFPSLKVVGCNEDFPMKIMDKIFPDVEGEWNVTNFEIAESLKYISNTWHALKIVFTNEVASILKKYNTDSESAMDIFLKDKKLNISSHYMKPGFAYGGSCLPKDLSALLSLSQKANINTPLLNSISRSNIELINRLELLITKQNLTNIGFSGVSFKPNTDDIRNSPIVTVIKNLIRRDRSYQKKYNILLYDHLAALTNFSKEVGLDVSLVNDENQLVDACEIIVLGPHKISGDNILKMLEKNKMIIDLKWHKLDKDIRSNVNYHSLL